MGDEENVVVAVGSGACRREHERHELSAKLAVQAADWASLEAECVDVSYGGMGLVLDAEIDAGDRLVFGLRDSQARTHRLVAVVRHTRQLENGRWRVGLAWELSSAEQLDAVESLVDEVTPGKRVSLSRAA